MNLRIVSIAMVFAVYSTRASGHELKVPTVPSDEVAMIQPPLEGSEAFARDLAGHWQGLVPEDQMQALQRISENLGWLDKERYPSPGIIGTANYDYLFGFRPLPQDNITRTEWERKGYSPHVKIN